MVAPVSVVSAAKETTTEESGGGGGGEGGGKGKQGGGGIGIDRMRSRDVRGSSGVDDGDGFSEDANSCEVAAAGGGRGGRRGGGIRAGGREKAEGPKGRDCFIRNEATAEDGMSPSKYRLARSAGVDSRRGEWRGPAGVSRVSGGSGENEGVGSWVGGGAAGVVGGMDGDAAALGTRVGCRGRAAGRGKGGGEVVDQRGRGKGLGRRMFILTPDATRASCDVPGFRIWNYRG